MVELTAQPIRPMTHVMVVNNSDVSGSTIGYHGTVIRVIDQSILANPSAPARWSYRVFIPQLKAEYAIVADKIISTDETDDPDTLGHAIRDIQFDVMTTEESHGAYRINSREWLHFHFCRHDALSDEWSMSMPMNRDEPDIRRLRYRVGSEAVMDKEYVLRSIERALSLKSELM